MISAIPHRGQNDRRLNAMSPGYLRTMGMELIAGRDFEPA